MTDITPSPIRSRKPKGQGPSRRGEILAAATRIFLQEGVAHATMRRIAAVVGVSPTALYVYFPDKDAILKAIAQEWFAAMLHAVGDGEGKPVGTAARFEACLRSYIEFGMANPDGYRLTFLSSAATKMGHAPCEAIPEADHSFAVLQQGVEAMMREGYFRTCDAESAAETIWACLHGVTALLIDQADHLSTPPQHLISMAVEMVMRGFRP